MTSRFALSQSTLSGDLATLYIPNCLLADRQIDRLFSLCQASQVRLSSRRRNCAVANDTVRGRQDDFDDDLYAHMESVEDHFKSTKSILHVGAQQKTPNRLQTQAAGRS
eukprot:TRINITY_DN9237_c0_g1_i1.p2 TRINITY_DN9237_c0_g1~~TRINITY_DN9237_c0_g1_i1.p2  ORF type:complete len:109 (+),score=5.51 TRINITY_DN9237_c0_g1_i1:529-855(+)